MIFPRGTRRAAVEARLDNEISSLETDPNIKDLVNTLEASISDLSDVKKQRPLNKDEKECLSKLERLKALQGQREALANLPRNPIRRVLADLLSDKPETYSFHRYQMLVWTLILGFVFVAGVVSDRKVPEFDTATLALLGISAGTYLGFKLPGVTKGAEKNA